MLAFAVRFGVQVVYWSTAAHQNQQLEGWMTPRYIALAYGVEDADLAALLASRSPEDQRKPLYRIAQRDDLALAALIADVQALVDAKGAGQ
jgi:hypothetical protein